MRKYFSDRLRLFASVLFLLLASSVVVKHAVAYPLTDEERARLRAAIPRTFGKLEARQSVQITILGDSVSRVFTPDDQANQTIHGMHAQFATRLATEFFYPGGVRVINPLKDEPEKRDDTLGAEIYLENLAIPGHTAIDAVQRITTDAFLHDPDLMMICYGVNESVRDSGLETYRKAIVTCIETCRQRGVDVILLGPNIIRQSPGPTGWGLTRSHATKAAEIAKAGNVFFVDLGRSLSRRGGIPFNKEAKEHITTYADRLDVIFKRPPEIQVEDWLHPNHTAHTFMGDQIYRELMKGRTADEPFRLTTQTKFANDGKVAVTVLLRNVSDKARRGSIAALAMRRQLSPDDAYHGFDLKPGESKTFSLTYAKVPAPGQEDLAEPVDFYALDAQDSKIRLSFLVADEDQSSIIDSISALEPVSVEWKTDLLTNVTNSVRLDWSFVNGSDKAVTGRYVAQLDGNRTDGQFTLDQGQSKSFYADFGFAPGADVVRQKMEASITLEVGGRSFEFNRHIEATRDLFLTEKVALSNYDDYLAKGSDKTELGTGEKGITLRADADDSALYLTFDFEGVGLQKLPSGSSLIADLSIDGRPVNEVRTFGAVDRVRFTSSAEDGFGETGHMRPGFFGNGYDKKVDERYIISKISTRTDLGRRVLVRIPRKYLFRHEWALDSVDSMLGLNVSLSLATIDPATGAIGFPASSRYVLASSGYYFRDARALATLRLTNAKAPLWSVRVW